MPGHHVGRVPGHVRAGVTAATMFTPTSTKETPVAHLLYFEFPSDGPFGLEATAAYGDLAADIAQEDGLIWKIWTEDAVGSRAGGVYLFTDEASADRYVEKHTARLASFGISGVEARSIGVQGELSAVTRAHLG